MIVYLFGSYSASCLVFNTSDWGLASSCFRCCYYAPSPRATLFLCPTLNPDARVRKSNPESQDLCLRVPQGRGGGGVAGGGGRVNTAKAHVVLVLSPLAKAMFSFNKAASRVSFAAQLQNLQLTVTMESLKGGVTKVHVTGTLSAALLGLRFTGVQYMNHVHLYEMICLHIWWLILTALFYSISSLGEHLKDM